jgi:glycosyltransferase involved in cell wall biosynthesis
MQVLITAENHYEYGADGRIYGEGPAKYSFWSNYLAIFDEVLVLARVGARCGDVREEARADGPRVSFCALPDYQGPWQYLRNLPELKKLVKDAVDRCDAYLLRVPGLVGTLAWREIKRRRKPYALEVVGDPWDALSPGTVPSLFRPLFRRVATRDLKAMCRGAAAVHYVTQSALQARYPPNERAHVAGFSDALMDSAFASAAIRAERARRTGMVMGAGGASAKRFRVGFIGSLSQMYKGPDVLLRAAALCGERGMDFEIAMAGDGRYAAAMKELARELRIEERVQFLGQLPFGETVFQFLDSVDLFVMPSRAEGLPRALLEAMARGCPCIGSNIGGIAEVLAAEDLVPSGNARELADKILEVADDPERMKRMGLRNLEKAEEFNPERLKEVRRAFFEYVKLHASARN